MRKDMSLAEIWEKTVAIRKDGLLVLLKVQADEKPTGITAKNPCIASCDPLGEGEWSVALWRRQLTGLTDISDWKTGAKIQYAITRYTGVFNPRKEWVSLKLDHSS